MQRSVNDTKKLFNNNGEVTFGGWSKAPLFEYNKEKYLRPDKIREHDCYYIANDHVGLYLAVETQGMELAIKVVLANFRRNRTYGDFVSKRWILSPQNLPQAGTLGEFSYTDNRIAITLTNTVEGRYIKCDFIDFANIKNLYIKLLVKKISGESLNMVVPFSDSPKSFFLKRFVPKFVANGMIQYGGTQYKFTENNSRVYLDWSRYNLPKKTEYQTLSASFDLEGHRFALNLGSPVGDTRKGNENCFFIDGNLYKLKKFIVKGDDRKYENSHYFLGNNGTELIFTPVVYNDNPMLCRCKKSVIVFGKLNGIICHDEIENIKIKDQPAHMVFGVI